MTRPAWFTALLVAALGLVLAFLVVPVVSVFVQAGPAELLGSLGDPGALDALWLSLRTTLAAIAIIVVVGTPAAYLLATRRFRGRSLVITAGRAAARAAAGRRRDRAARGARVRTGCSAASSRTPACAWCSRPPAWSSR